jgi:copper transport protein
VFPIVRWLGYLGLVLLCGAILVLALWWPPRLDNTGIVRIIWIAAGMVAVATAGELAVQVPNVAGGFAAVGGADIISVLASPYGQAHLLRLALLVAAVILVRPLIRHRSWGFERVLLAALGSIAIDTWSVAGHPYASAQPAVTIVADMVHVAAMCVWLGGLVMLAIFVLPRADAAELARIVPAWSRWAATAVVALVVSGAVQAVVEVGSWSAVVGTSYGRLVLLKVVLLAGVLVVAAFSRRLVRPVAAGTVVAARTLRTLVATEAVGVVAIVAIASVLVQTAPTAATAATTAPAAAPIVLAAPSRLFTLTIEETPGRVGVNQVDLYVTQPEGQRIAVVEWRVTAALPAQGIEAIAVPIVELAENHGLGQVTLPAPGAWTFTFTIRLSELDEDSVTTSISILP